MIAVICGIADARDQKGAEWCKFSIEEPHADPAAHTGRRPHQGLGAFGGGGDVADHPRRPSEWSSLVARRSVDSTFGGELAVLGVDDQTSAPWRVQGARELLRARAQRHIAGADS